MCLYLREQGRINLSAIEQLWSAIDERLYLFIDNAAFHTSDIEALMRQARASSARVTVVTTARINEWDLQCEGLDGFVGENKPSCFD